MTQTSALAVIGIFLLAACATVIQTVRVIARARIRRQRRLVRLSSVVTGMPAGSPNDQFS
ncbi:MAG: hypothetical protein ABSE42_01085 [Bryobacteraceae bacterium]|jgi:HAMP domain-containing protein